MLNYLLLLVDLQYTVYIYANYWWIVLNKTWTVENLINKTYVYYYRFIYSSQQLK